MTESVTVNHISNPFQHYTIPYINTGKLPNRIPRGSTKAQELAKNKWCVEFYFSTSSKSEPVRIRISKQLNRIKDYQAKAIAFNELLAKCTNDLENGWNPTEAVDRPSIKPEQVGLHLGEAIKRFTTYHTNKGNRAKTIGSYESKLKLFYKHLGDIPVCRISDYHVTEFLNHSETTRSWTGVTYNFARIVLNNFFVYLKRYKEIDVNPATGLEGRKEIKTDSHQVFSDDDFTTIMTWLREHDPYCLLFVKTIYYTCIRPKELRCAQLKHVDLANSKIIIPAHIAKNKKALPVQLDITLKEELLKLNISGYPQDFYLFGDTVKIIGVARISENTPYNRFQKCLRQLGLTNKNYTLYSFKHLSNVRKYLAGWSIAEICAANRHSSLVETETYLKDLIKFIPVTKKIPDI